MIEGDVVLLVSEDRPLPWLRLDGTTIEGNLVIRGAGANCGPVFVRPEAAAQIEGRGLIVRGDLRIEGVTVTGIILNNARIAGDIRLICASIEAMAVPEHRTADAVRCRDLHVEGSIFFRGTAGGRGRMTGRVFLAGARIGGMVEFAGVDFRLPLDGNETGRDGAKRKTLTLANANIGGDLAWLDKPGVGGPCTAAGHLNIDSSHVGGRLRIALETADEVCLSLKACEIDAAIQIRALPPSATNSGTLEIDASDAVADAIQVWGYKDRPGETPKAWSLRVPGTAYAGLAGSETLERKSPAQLTEDFLGWFRRNVVEGSARHRHDSAFSPQPYQHFVALCRAEGFNDAADDAVIAWIKETHGRGIRRFLYAAFSLVSKYGLDPGRATWAFVLAWMLCAAAVLGLQFGLPKAFVDPEPQSSPAEAYVMSPGRGGNPAEQYRVRIVDGPQAAGFECARRVNPVVYALDVMLPIADFRQEELCPQRGRDMSDGRVLAVSTGFALFRILGAVLSAILLLAFSGINRRIWR